MTPLAFPTYDFETRTDADGRAFVLDPVRRRFVRLTPEEWVRQHLLRLLADLGYPPGLTAVEKKMAVAGRSWRADVYVVGPSGTPLLVAECKAPSVPVTQDAFDQVARYNLTARARCLVVTNGLTHYVCALEEGAWRFLKAIPPFVALQGR